MKPKLYLKTYRHEERRCPKCGAKITASTSMTSPEGPSTGDITVCTYCLVILTYCDGLTLRTLTATERMELTASPNWQLVKDTIAAVRVAWATHPLSHHGPET